MTNFSDDYVSAREQFRAAAQAAGAQFDSLAIDGSGPQGERLTIDIARLGAPDAGRLLIHSSGLHGVEGFAGSAVQHQVLQQPPALTDDCALLLVHVLNPYGMAWLRRTNAANVDLNRNFIFQKERRPGEAENYSRLNPLLNPSRPPGQDLFYLRALFSLLQYGYRPLKMSIAEGQYQFPEGLFFGGMELQREVLLYRDWLRSKLSQPQRLLVIDLHTGLGKPGQESLFQSLAAVPAAELSELLATPVLSDGRDTEVLGYRTRGGHEELYRNLFPGCRIDFITQEFGTKSSLQVLQALRRENQWHHYGAGSVEHGTKRALKAAFCLNAPGWRQRIVERGVRLIRKGLESLALEKDRQGLRA